MDSRSGARCVSRKPSGLPESASAPVHASHSLKVMRLAFNQCCMLFVARLIWPTPGLPLTSCSSQLLLSWFGPCPTAARQLPDTSCSSHLLLSWVGPWARQLPDSCPTASLTAARQLVWAICCSSGLVHGADRSGTSCALICCSANLGQAWQPLPPAACVPAAVCERFIPAQSDQGRGLNPKP